MEKGLEASWQSPPTQEKCQEHQIALAMFCREDRTPMCQRRAESQACSVHAAVPLREAAEEYKVLRFPCRKGGGQGAACSCGQEDQTLPRSCSCGCSWGWGGGAAVMVGFSKFTTGASRGVCTTKGLGDVIIAW